MGGFYVTCKVFPVFTFVTLYEKILRKVKVLTQNFMTPVREFVPGDLIRCSSMLNKF